MRGVFFALLMVFLFSWVGGLEHIASAQPSVRDAALVSSEVASLDPPRRLVVLKFDGLMPSLIDQYVAKINPRTGRSYLPWIKHVFYDQGVRIGNFYTRGLSLSGSSWSLLDTGQHMVVKGNVEFDRATGHADDYLNFLRFYIETINDRHAYPRSVEVLDEAGVLLLTDAYSHDEKHVGWQLSRRGAYWELLADWLKKKYVRAPPDEWIKRLVVGFDGVEDGVDINVTKLVEAIPNSRLHYLDAYGHVFDKVAHGTNDEAILLKSLQYIDNVVGRVFSAIQQSARVDDTILVMMSDHGTNTDPKVSSQGFNLARFLSSTVNGAHHVFTKRVVMARYQWKPSNPLSPTHISESGDSYYLRGKKKYVTAILDFDGNEQSMLHLRNSDLNKLHILLLEMKKSKSQPVRQALKDAFFDTIDLWRGRWQRECDELKEELYALDALRQNHERDLKLLQTDPSMARLDRVGRPILWSDDPAFTVRQRYLELKALAGNAAQYRREYETAYQMLTRLLALQRDSFDPRRVKEEQLILPGVMGPRNSVHQLQHYVVGINEAVLDADGKLDEEKSFWTLDYFDVLRTYRVSNNYQTGISPHPIDFLATRVPYVEIAPALQIEGLEADEDVVWLFGSRDRQALILIKNAPLGGRLLRYVPIAGLVQTPGGGVQFRRIEFQPGLPLAVWEDDGFTVPRGDEAKWLTAFQTEKDWRQAVHLTKYSLAVIGLAEEFGKGYAKYFAPLERDSTPDRLVKRFYKRKKDNMEADLLLHASDHWNFDMKDFNPGGNHGSFFRPSTHSVFMFWGGSKTGLRRGAAVEAPYDGLSCAPTLLEAAGLLRQGQLTSRLKKRGFRPFPGEVIYEIFEDRQLN